ncbi:hypothetical protein BAUCODRAFT_189418 [Baudoinia panamericana UAMH 10762]|uniref:Mitochondrial ribosomal protein subunit S18 n=1 Tax=Baudoinia panamericana (strain UAMH 10762) TaxID=717646 RepID=M2NNW1_BAUPA|nr:uncharacterized protein BAUCODRAFT_189418 [Baudoinia panamericana UAMH 10762]EMD00926.1 hypothetical protein BAUCODRAFT_189418 [Baudoinia panamericana UAMH 10762]
MAAPRVQRLVTPFVCQSCRHKILSQHSILRTFSTTSVYRADDPPPAASAVQTTLGALSSNITTSNRSKGFNSPTPPSKSMGFIDALDGGTSDDRDIDSLLGEYSSRNQNPTYLQKPHRIYVYSTKHNTHITFVQPPKSAAETSGSGISSSGASAAEKSKMVTVLLSVSAGNLNFKKAARGSYDAAYQLSAFVLGQIRERGMLRDVRGLEVVLRGFGAGREAFTKVMLGAEGRNLRGRVSAVIDATRLKLGGPRGKRPRRLG